MTGLSSQTLAAGTTGTLSGTVTAGDTKTPLAGALVTATSPTGRYTAHTDARGFFSFTGVTPDTYTVAIAAGGYDAVSVSGVTVFADQQQQVSQTLTKSLTQIGRTRATQRSVGTAFQPAQTTDTYTVTSQQIDTVLGKKFNSDETTLLGSLPGVTFDSSGYPTLRGGRVTEEGFQFEGIDYTDAFLSQFVNTLSLTGQGSLQLTPGAGDATSGNTGTGIINLIAKRGSYPAFGTFDAEVGGGEYAHQFAFEYGTASPNGRFSDYLAFTGERVVSHYGYNDNSGNAARDLNIFYTGRSYFTGDNTVNNFVYRFGHDNSQSLQVFYQNQANRFFFNRGGTDSLFYKTNDPYTLANLTAITGGVLSNADFQSIASLSKYQTSVIQKAPFSPPNDYQPNDTFKVQYSNNLNPSTFLTAKFYKVNAVTDFSNQFASNSFFFDGESQQGGLRSGFSLDFTKQVGSKHLLQAGGKYEFLTPVFDYPDNITGLAAVDFNQIQLYDFLDPSNPNSTGYLGGFFPAGAIPKVPIYLETTNTHRQDFALYLQDTFTPNDNLKVTYGVRMDGVNYRYPGFNSDAYAIPGGYSGDFLPTSTGVFTSGPNMGLPDPSQDRFDYDKQALQPRVVEPKIGISYRLGRNDALRFSYARSVQFAPLGFVDVSTSRSPFAAFTGIPTAVFGQQTPVPICGPTGDRLCRDYADELYWSYQNTFGGIPFQPVKPETFSNWEASYSHQFAHNIAMKITPFYRRGYDALVLTATQKVINGVPQFDATGAPILNPSVSTALGINKTTGVELYVTKDAEFGLSGSLSATYINEFTNIPPTQAGEDFIPTIPPPTLALGSLFRVGYLSPFQFTLAPSYRTRSGWRVTPNLQYNMGYPIGSGQIAQTFFNGTAVNVPNTNITNSAQLNGPQGASCFVDPQNPGSIFKPNVTACRGTPDGPSPGSVLSNQSLTAAVSLEYSPPKAHKYTSTFGIKVDNLFNNVYNIPALNLLYQPLTNGVAGPKTGYSSNPINFPNNGFSVPSAERYSFSPYVNTPNNVGRTFRVYYQIGF